MSRAEGRRPESVPSEAKQAGEIRSRWGWVEPSAWTDRMLATLERGVKGGKNAFFAEQGLYSLQRAHAQACQSCRR